MAHPQSAGSNGAALSARPAVARASMSAGERRARLAALRAPLLIKIIGANAGVAIVVYLIARAGTSPIWVSFVAIALLLVAHFGLVLVALRPVRDLEDVAERIWSGDYAVRVANSPVADRELLRIGAMFNALLDDLAADRDRLRGLAVELVDISDRERAALGHELHDSAAQQLAALLMQISSAARDCNDPGLARRLEAMRDAAATVTEEIRLLAHTIHPRVLDDLGLVPALRKLARETTAATGIEVELDAPAAIPDLSRVGASVLYLVAQESTRNATRHADPQRIHIRAWSDGARVSVEVRDAGRGFDLDDAMRRRPGMGLFRMRERVALLNGRFEVHTSAGNGTTVIVDIPIESATHSLIGEHNAG